MGLFPRRNSEPHPPADTEPDAAPDATDCSDEQDAFEEADVGMAPDGGGGAPPPEADVGATDHPSRGLGDIYIESNDADNTVFGDPAVEQQARKELRDLTRAALKATGAIKE